MKEDLNKTGYSEEEAYFNRLNQELIEKLKNKGGTEELNKPKEEEPGTASPEESPV